MNAFDFHILNFLNQYSRKSLFFDQVVGSLAGNNLFKGGLIIAIFWGYWFTDNDFEQEKIRKTILVTFIGTFLGLFITRVLVNTLPFRPRPIHNNLLKFVLPYGVSKETLLDHAMSFPSDHASMFFALGTGIFLISRRLGFIVLGYVLINSFLLRVYYGYHHPSDIIAGALIGTTSVILTNIEVIRKHVVDRVFQHSKKYPRIFYGVFFIVSYQAATLFNDTRKLVGGGIKYFKIVWFSLIN